MNDCADICGGVLHLVWHKDNEKCKIKANGDKEYDR